MRAVARLAEDDLSAGVTRERLLFALVLLFEWHHAFTGQRRDLSRTYREAATGSCGEGAGIRLTPVHPSL